LDYPNRLSKEYLGNPPKNPGKEYGGKNLPSKGDRNSYRKIFPKKEIIGPKGE